jgi:hypothetical protein
MQQAEIGAPETRRGAWKSFCARERTLIEGAIRALRTPACARCHATLEFQPASRLAGMLPPGAEAYDLDCRACRRFYTVIAQDEESVQGERLRRLALAVLGA